MQTMNALEAKNRFGRLLDEARRHPVTITKNGRAAVVVMSIEDYERSRLSAADRLGAILDQAAREASDKGLTDAQLDALLADES